MDVGKGREQERKLCLQGCRELQSPFMLLMVAATS